jgi:hypothetical protein
MLPVRSAMARDNSRIACWPFVNEYKLHKRAIYRKTPPKRGSHFWVHGDARPGADRISS